MLCQLKCNTGNFKKSMFSTAIMQMFYKHILSPFFLLNCAQIHPVSHFSLIICRNMLLEIYTWCYEEVVFGISRWRNRGSAVSLTCANVRNEWLTFNDSSKAMEGQTNFGLLYLLSGILELKSSLISVVIFFLCFGVPQSFSINVCRIPVFSLRLSAVTIWALLTFFNAQVNLRC